MHLKKCKLALFTFLFLPCLLFANTVEQEDNSSGEIAISDQMLIKPSFLEFEDSDTEDESQGVSNTQPALNPDFFSNLQANATPLPTQPGANTTDPYNTWVPKFVWIGDVKNNDELKCFAAFLIGSLANKDENGSTNTSPGVFMTPYTTNAQQTQDSPAIASNLATSKKGLPSADQLISKRANAAPPTPKPVASKFYVETQYGIGFLYFAGVRGNIVPEPSNYFKDIAATNGAAGSPVASFPIRGHIEYNRTVLWTADFGFKLADWAYFAATFQTQQGIFIRTKPFQSAHSRSGGTAAFSSVNFQSNLDLYSVGGKLTFVWPDILSFSSWNMSLYLGGSASGGWQSWTNVTANQMYFNNSNSNLMDTMTSSNISFRPKTFGTFAYTGEAGLVFKPNNIFAKTSLRLGCKFLGWGTTRGLGLERDQRDIIRDATQVGAINEVGPILFHYWKPIRFTTIYSWAPYFGFNWEF